MEDLYYKLGELLAQYNKRKISQNEFQNSLAELFNGDWEECFDAGARYAEGGKMPRNDTYARDIIFVCLQNGSIGAREFIKLNPKFMRGAGERALPSVKHYGTFFSILGVLLCAAGILFCVYKWYVLGASALVLAVALCAAASWDFMKNGCDNALHYILLSLSAAVGLPVFIVLLFCKAKLADNFAPMVVCREDGEVLHQIKAVRFEVSAAESFLIVENDYTEKKIKLAELDVKKGVAKDEKGNVYKGLKRLKVIKK